MLRWVTESVESPYGKVSALNWAVEDAPLPDEQDDPMPDLDDAEDQLGSVLWNSNTAVLNYLHEKIFKGENPEDLHVVELGAGVGVLGIALAMGGAKVAITDIKELVPLMKRNIQLNKGRRLKKTRDAFPCIATTWRWGIGPVPKEILQHLEKRVDLVVMCDALYGNPKDWPHLIATLNTILDLTPECTVINFCEQRVDSVEEGFLKLLGNTDPRWTWKTKALSENSSLDMVVKVTRLSRKVSADDEEPKTKKPRHEN